MIKLTNIIDAFHPGCSRKGFEEYGFILKFRNDKEAYFFSICNNSALEWSKKIVKAFTYDLPIEIEFDEDYQIHSITLDIKQ